MPSPAAAGFTKEVGTQQWETPKGASCVQEARKVMARGSEARLEYPPILVFKVPRVVVATANQAKDWSLQEYRNTSDSSLF